MILTYTWTVGVAVSTMAQWKCMNCTLVNEEANENCNVCGYKNHQAVLSYPDSNGIDDAGKARLLEYPESSTNDDGINHKNYFICYLSFCNFFFFVALHVSIRKNS